MMASASSSYASRDPFVPRLVGREREQAVLRTHLAAAFAGQGQLILVGGEAGIGKTVLVEDLCYEAVEQGALVLTGRCYDLTETPPYGPWVELFGAYGPTAGNPPLPAAFATRDTLGTVESQDLLIRDVRGFLATLSAQRPIVLFFDDLHWGDPASVSLVRVVARYLTTQPILIVVTYRSNELSPEQPLATLLPAFVREAHAEQLALRSLGSDAIRALITARYHLKPGDTARLLAYVTQQAEGNPFFVRELLRTLEDERILRGSGTTWTLGELTSVPIPPLVRFVIEGRLARLGNAARHLLAVAAVIGPDVTLALWTTVADVSEGVLEGTIERAIEAHVFASTRESDRLAFSHALIREALYLSTPLIQRRSWHRRTGEILSRRAHPDPDAVAYHFRQADDRRATDWLIKAGERAQHTYAWQTAVARYELALTHMDAENTDAARRCMLLLLLGLLKRLTDPAGGVACLEAAARLAASIRDPLIEAAAVCYMGHVRCVTGDLLRGLAEMTVGIAALDALSSTDRARLDALIDSGLMVSEYSPWGTYAAWLDAAGRFAEAERVALRVVEAPARETPYVPTHARYADASQALGQVYGAVGRPDAAHQAFARARYAYQSFDHHVLHGLTAMWELRWLALSYRTDQLVERAGIAAEAEQAWAQASDAQWSTDLPPRAAQLALLIVEGAWSEARQLAVLIQASAIFSLDFQPDVAMLEYLHGNVTGAQRIIRETIPAGPDASPGSLRCICVLQLQRLAAMIAIEAGDHQTARAWLAAHDRWLAWSSATLGQSEGQGLWAQYYRAIGDGQQARAHAARALRHATHPRQPLALIAAYRVSGELDTEVGRYDEAAQHLASALTLADACAAPHERALTLIASAELLGATGDRAGALALLDEIRAVCLLLDARPTLQRVERLLDRYTVTQGQSTANPAALSDREIEVLRLIAAGNTNREIADCLFLSQRTIDVHVRNIFAKTQTENRAAATAFAFRHHIA